MTRGRGWSLDLAKLADLRSAPLVGPDSRAWTDADGLVTIELAFLAQPVVRRRVLLHQGDLGAAAAGSGWGWSFALQGDVAELQTWDADASAAWVATLGPDPWHVLALTLRFGTDWTAPRFVHGRLDGRPLDPAPWRDPGDAIGELPVVEGLVLGGARDRAGGHTNLRFGERRGELVRSWTVSAGPAPASDAVAGVDRAAPTATVGDVHPEGLRYRAAPLEPGDEVWWDFEDEVAVGATVDRPAALSPAALSVHWLPRAAAPRELAAPLQPGATRPVPVFAPGDGGYAAFRIPAVVRAGDGALLAFAEGRLESISDACRTKDLVMRRSRDDGATWGPLQRVAAAPGRSLMNPSPVVAGRGAGARVVLTYSRLDADEWRIAAGAGRATLRARLSDDHGATWSDEVDVAAQLDLPAGLADAWPDPSGWRIQVGTLGHAIELGAGPHPGRLCCAGHGTFGAGSVFDSVAFLFWSDDRGETWRMGPALARRDDGTPARGLGESTLAELPDGSLLVNSRHYRDRRPVGRRAVTRVAWDADGEPRPGEARADPTLVDSGVQGSLLWVAGDGPHGRLLFCNPAHPTARVRLTLRESRDGGVTWPRARLLVAGAAGYSDLVDLGDGAVGVVFEDGGDGRIAYLRVDGGSCAAQGSDRDASEVIAPSGRW
jgi:sialidase-1